MFKRFVNFVAVILLFVGFDAHGALEKIRDSEYMRTVYQHNINKTTILHELGILYSGQFRGGSQRGFDTWKQDAHRLSGDLIEKSLPNFNLTQWKQDFKLWQVVTCSGNLFVIHWPSQLRSEAAQVLNDMLTSFDSVVIPEHSGLIEECRGAVRDIIVECAPTAEFPK